MGFEQIKLNKEQLEDLYASNLVITGLKETVTASKENKSSTKGITGKNKKQFVWLVNEPNYPFLSDADFQFLSDVINACKMNLDDIALVNIAQCELDFSQIVEELQPRFLIGSFLDRNWISASHEFYTLYLENGFQLYLTESPETLRTDKVRKSKLWLTLKQMLGL